MEAFVGTFQCTKNGDNFDEYLQTLGKKFLKNYLYNRIMKNNFYQRCWDDQEKSGKSLQKFGDVQNLARQ